MIGIDYTHSVDFWPDDKSRWRSAEGISRSDGFQINITTNLYKFRFATRRDRRLGRNLQLEQLQIGGRILLANPIPLESLHNLWWGWEINPALRVEFVTKSDLVQGGPVTMLLCATKKQNRIHSIDFGHRPIPRQGFGSEDPRTVMMCGFCNSIPCTCSYRRVR